MVKNKFKDSLKSGTFKVGVMGISTTAGHDCHHNQSYVHVFQRHMQVTRVCGPTTTIVNAKALWHCLIP